MDPIGNWRTRARTVPRLALSGVLGLTGVAGFLASFSLLRAGVLAMCVRYPIAVLAGYGVFLGLLRIWVALERARFDPRQAALPPLNSRAGEGGDTSKPQQRKRPDSTWDYLDFPDVGWEGGDEGCLLGVLLGVFLVLGLVFFGLIAEAPALLAEVFLDAVLVGALYRRMKVAARHHWLGTAVKRTWICAVLTALMVGLGGACLDHFAPSTHSLGLALQKLKQEWGQRK